MWESCSVLQRPKWGFRTCTIFISRTVYLGFGCPLQTCPWTCAVTGGSLQHNAGMPDTYCPSSLYGLNTTFLSMECPSETATYTSMAAMLQELLARAVLNTSSLVPGHTTPKRSTSVTLGAPSLIGSEDPFSKERADSAAPEPMATSSQVSLWVATIDNTIPISHFPSLTPTLETPKVDGVPTTLQSDTHLGATSGTLSDEVLWIQGEMNTAMGWLLTTRSSMDACHRRLVSDTKTAFHQNEARTTEAIKEARAHCTAVTWEAEATCAATIQEAEAKCAVTIREVETACVDCAHKLQQWHGESMQNIEREAIEEEGWDDQSFLNACGVALQACPPKHVGYSYFPYSC